MINSIKNNPKLSILMVILASSVAVVANPSLISFLPDSAEDTVKGVATLIATISALLGFSTSPNKEEDKK